MERSQWVFLAVTAVIGLFIGLALSFLVFAYSHSYASFIMVPICLVMVFFQMSSSAKRKAETGKGPEN